MGVLIVLTLYSEDREEGNEIDDRWTAICFCLSLAGFGIRVVTVGHTPAHTSGRERSMQRADALNTSGLYSIVRHPLYLGNFLVGFGFALFPHSWVLLLVYCLAFWLYYERIMFAEEAFLLEKFADQFVQWSGVTPAFIPDPGLWKSWELPFSLRNVLKREYSGFLAIIAMFFFLDQVDRYLATGSVEVTPLWLVLLAVGVLAALVLRALRKKTDVLDVKGR
jgi:protein-S-isoprenylcysteine O-methyltransferase Ste14